MEVLARVEKLGLEERDEREDGGEGSPRTPCPRLPRVRVTLPVASSSLAWGHVPYFTTPACPHSPCFWACRRLCFASLPRAADYGDAQQRGANAELAEHRFGAGERLGVPGKGDGPRAQHVQYAAGAKPYRPPYWDSKLYGTPVGNFAARPLAANPYNQGFEENLGGRGAVGADVPVQLVRHLPSPSPPSSLTPLCLGPDADETPSAPLPSSPRPSY